MTFPLLAFAVLLCVVVAWLVELRHAGELLPTLGNRRHFRPFAIIAVVALLIAIGVLWPLLSVAEWPRSTQVAWTAVEAPDPSTPLIVGGPEHAAILGWPNGNFWPLIRVERGDDGFRLFTGGGTAFVRVDGQYANGDVVMLGDDGKQIGKFSIKLKRRGFLRRRKLLIGRTAMAEPLIVMDPPPAQRKRALALDSLLVSQLHDLRRQSAIDLATAHALEEWAGSIRILMPADDELHLISDDEPYRVHNVPSQATIEILWPRRRQVIRLSESDGAPRLSFEPPWTRTTSLPPFRGAESTLSFARNPAAGTNTFLLPLGYGAPSDFHQDAVLQLSPAGLPRFRDGMDLAPAAPANTPRWLHQIKPEALRSALEPNRSLSSLHVPLGRALRLTITIVRDLPTPRALLIALGCAWATLVFFVASIAFGNAGRLRLRDLWCIGVALLAVWAILATRVLLAVRYLLTPTAVDEVTVKGLAGTLAALIIVPGFIALAVRLWLHHRPGLAREPRNVAITIVVAVVLAAMSIVEYVVMPRQVLPNLASVFLPAATDRILLVVYGVAALAIASAAGYAVALWQLPYRIVFDHGRAFWQTLSEQQAQSTNPVKRVLLDPVARVGKALWAPALKPLFLLWLVVSVLVLGLSFIAPEYVRQIVAPFWIIGVPTFLLLARPIANPEDALRALGPTGSEPPEPTLVDTIAAVVLLVFVPVAIVVAFDFGSIYSVLAFLFPLALLLLLTPAWRLAATLLIVLVAAIALAYWILLGTYAIAPGMTEHVLSRVEVMKYGSAAQEWLLELNAPSASGAQAVTASNVRNALVHEWEQMAMVRKGGWRGLGFDRAPAAQSFIRQDTIQYDSVYSFFIVGEHGIAGGLLLLVIYAIPAIVLLLRRNALRAGEMVAIAVAAAFLGEAVAHAAMNVSQLWFSGRNLPLLATSSNSDVIRWALLLGLMAQALLWSSGLRADSFDTVPETAITRSDVYDGTFVDTRRRLLIRLSMLAVVAIGGAIAYATRDPAWLGFAIAIPLAVMLRKRAVPALALLPALLVVVLVVRGSVRALQSDEFDVLTWSRLLRQVDKLYDSGMLRFDEKRKLILFCEDAQQCTERPTGATLLEAEVLRFNSLPEQLRMDGGRESLPSDFFDGLGDPGAYYQRMFALWQRQTARTARMRPSVFAVQRIEDENEGMPTIRYEVTGNPDFNIVHSFVEARPESEVQPVSIAGNVQVLGRAWAMGRWVYAPTRNARALGLGWVEQLGNALLRVPRARRAAIGRLTLDADLQRLTQATVEATGRQIYAGLVADGAPQPLPPRVAFTILRATTGEVLAMSAWPHAAEASRWMDRTVAAGGRSWIERDPPFSWLSGTAPRPLASRHAADHNLEAIEMGSAAKPFWATAALTIHPRLKRLLWTRNGDCDRVVENRCYERYLFGADVGKGWQVTAAPRRWIDFDTYLASSDNRYQTRLGFLALARGTTQGGIVPDGRGATASDRESLSGEATPWRRYPALPDSMAHSRLKPQHIENLHEQRLAFLMRDLFGVHSGTPPAEGDLRRYRVSFWSGEESDDLRTSEALEPLASVSPEAVDLRLNRVTSTRDFIAILLGGASSRWSNIDAAAALSTWAMHRPVVPHVVAAAHARPLASRATAFNADAAAAADKLRTGLRRVLEDGTARAIRPQVQPLRDQYEVYAKTGTLSTLDPDRPTSRILVVIVARDAQGHPRNAITLSFVAERTAPGFATAQIGQFIHDHRDALSRLIENQ